jgi:hypothetical protein
MATDAQAAIISELEANWRKWESLVDADAEFGTEVAEILADSEDDQYGRIRDLRYAYAERCADYAIESNIWYGPWGELKRAAGLTEPSPMNSKEGLPTGWKDAA